MSSGLLRERYLGDYLLMKLLTRMSRSEESMASPVAIDP
jgi:hypothetical protein